MLSFQEADAKINIWEGSVRSGKTYISLWAFLQWIHIGPPGEYCIITRTSGTFEKNVLPLLGQMIHTDARFMRGKQQMNVWGKTIHVIGADDERAESKIRGPTFMGAYVDEATIIPESVFKMLISRCAMGGARIFATTNPDSPYHWLKVDYLTDNPDVKSWKFVLDDNPQLTEFEREYLKRQYKGLWYKRFIEGRWVQAEGAIYGFFEDSSGPFSNVIDYPQHTAEYYIVGVDYGTANPCAFTLVGVNPHRHPNAWVEREYYYDSRKAQRQKTDAEYAQDLSMFIQNRNVRAIYVDPSAASFKAELAKGGVGSVYDAKNEVVDGIRFLSTYLNEGTLKICRACPNLIQEFHSYVWDDKSLKSGTDKPLKENDHALDSLRYVIYSHFKDRPLRSMTPRDLDDLQREAIQGGPVLPPFFQQPNDSYRQPNGDNFPRGFYS